MEVPRAEAGAPHAPRDCPERLDAVSGPLLPLRTDLLRRISIDPTIRFGKPYVQGTRISVGDVLGYLAGGMSEAKLLADFLQLTHEDVLACLAFAAERERRVMPVPAA